MGVCRTRAERLSVSIAKNKAILFGDNVGVTLKNALDTRRELLQRGRFDFKRYRCFKNVGSVDFQQRGSVFLRCHAYFNFSIHGTYSTHANSARKESYGRNFALPRNSARTAPFSPWQRVHLANARNGKTKHHHCKNPRNSECRVEAHQRHSRR